jgi:hypothetical protein
MKLKLVFVSLAIALAQITPSNAQSISPAGHYTKKSLGLGEMGVEKSEGGWRVFVRAGGGERPRGLTAADCALVAVGAIEGNTFRGEIKYLGGVERDSKTMMIPDNAVEAGHNLTITFAPQSATLPDGQSDVVAAGCPDHTGLLGRYTKDRKQ